MPTYTLSYDIPHAIADNLVRALPAGGGRLYVSAGTSPSYDLSNNLDMSGVRNVTAGSGGYLPSGEVVAASFIRVNGGTSTVKITRE